ncbi:hypothetical protein O0880_09175 [Janthinobacterium sp. SUN118]|nr:hypothetical protein [Janthinobacterium sp. SUN118]MDN2709588.1 hypothetical protein [Janthinobacterium sp. SUN118]
MTDFFYHRQKDLVCQLIYARWADLASIANQYHQAYAAKLEIEEL